MTITSKTKHENAGGISKQVLLVMMRDTWEIACSTFAGDAAGSEDR